MEHYRAYLIGRDGHFLEVVDIVTENDETASERANLLMATTWSYGRRGGESRCSSAIPGNPRKPN
jgi:hypothetical protein